MSRFDYSKLASVAETLVTKFGAPAVVTIPGLAQDVVDDKPWRGKDTDGDVPVSIELAVTEFSDEEIDGTNILVTDKQGWSFPPSTGEDLRNARTATQGSVVYSIEGVLVIQPATEVLAYRFTLRK